MLWIFKCNIITIKFKSNRNDESTFIRSLDNKKYTFKNNELILLTIDKSIKFIKTLNQRNVLTNKIITLDIETFIKDGIMIPYVISWYDGINNHSYYLLDFNFFEDMIKSAIKDLMIKKIW